MRDSINYGTVVALKIYEPRYLHRFQRVPKYFFFATRFSSMHRSSEIANIKKKWGEFLARVHAKKISNFASEEYNLVYISCIDIEFTRKVGGFIRFAFSAARLHIFTRGKVIAHRHLPLALPTVHKNDYAKSCVNRRTIAYVSSCVRMARDAINVYETTAHPAPFQGFPLIFIGTKLFRALE